MAALMWLAVAGSDIALPEHARGGEDVDQPNHAPARDRPKDGERCAAFASHASAFPLTVRGMIAAYMQNEAVQSL